ncbi:vWA domain-containing protein [Halovenus marina]|uniref:vWA domain-containing protein n=1 Tax=Halovenus marina TaxID=3396621 RepID=UPI003F55E077
MTKRNGDESADAEPTTPDSQQDVAVADQQQNGHTTPTDRFREELVAFTRALRQQGADVPANASQTAAEALAEIGLSDRERVQRSLRAALLTRPTDYDLFDRLFAQFWSRVQDLTDPTTEPADEEQTGGLEPPTVETPQGDDEERTRREGDAGSEGVRRGVTEGQSGEPADDNTSATYSPAGQSERVDPSGVFGDGDRTETATQRLTRALATLPGRRTERANRGRRLDVRRSLRRSAVTGGTPLSLPKRDFTPTELRGVVFVDVSRSVLDVIDRDFLVRFLCELRTEWRSLRIFLFDTDVQEVSAAFDAETTTAAYDALERAEAQWGGGTRIGGALTAVRDRHPGAVDRRTITLVISDGLEMGDVSELEDGVVWLSQRSPLVLWLNPLAASPSFEPTASGMQAADPYVDGIFPFAGAADIEELARQLEQYTGTEPLGYHRTGVHT